MNWGRLKIISGKGVGSYWIYKNTKTGELDTQTCTGAKTFWDQSKGTQTYTNNITIDFERLALQKYSSYNKWTYNFLTTALKADGVSFDGKNRVIWDCEVASEGTNTTFFHPFIVGAATWSGSADMHCRNSDTTLIINNQTYFHAVVFELESDDIWNPNSYPLPLKYPRARYYWVNGIGLVLRRNFLENYSWELIDYKIQP